MSDSENERDVISMEGMVYIDEYPHSSENTYHINDRGYNSINLSKNKARPDQTLHIIRIGEVILRISKV